MGGQGTYAAVGMATGTEVEKVKLTTAGRVQARNYLRVTGGTREDLEDSGECLPSAARPARTCNAFSGSESSGDSSSIRTKEKIRD